MPTVRSSDLSVMQAIAQALGITEPLISIDLHMGLEGMTMVTTTISRKQNTGDIVPILEKYTLVRLPEAKKDAE